MGNPAVTNMSRVESQAVRHLGRTRKEGNGTNRTTLDLPDSVAVSQRGAVTLVRLSRPAKPNAIDGEMIAGIEAVFSSPPEGTRAIVVHGEASHFCAGADLALVAAADVDLGCRAAKL